MAMSTNNPQTSNRPRRSPATKPVVPAPSRAATARKIEPETELDELDFETEIKAVPRPVRANPAQEATRQAWLNRINELTQKRDELVDRLDTGAARIEKARAEGEDVSSWENFWIQLLRQYESVCDSLRDLYAQGPA